MRAAHLEHTRILAIIRLREVEVDTIGKMFGEHIRVPNPESRTEIDQTGSCDECAVLEPSYSSIQPRVQHSACMCSLLLAQDV